MTGAGRKAVYLPGLTQFPHLLRDANFSISSANGVLYSTIRT